MDVLRVDGFVPTRGANRMNGFLRRYMRISDRATRSDLGIEHVTQFERALQVESAMTPYVAKVRPALAVTSPQAAAARTRWVSPTRRGA